MSQCPVCSKRFKQYNNTKKYCSKECKYLQRKMSRPKKTKDTICCWCLKSFVTSKNEKYCSIECRKLMVRKQQANFKKTEKGKASIYKWSHSKKFREGQKRYQQKPRARALSRAHVKRYRQTENGRIYHRREQIQRITLKRNPNAGRIDWKAWEAKIERLGSKCLACGKIEITIDHIIPLSAPHFGTNNIENLQPLCRACNRKKWNTIINYEVMITCQYQ